MWLGQHRSTVELGVTAGPATAALSVLIELVSTTGEVLCCATTDLSTLAGVDTADVIVPASLKSSTGASSGTVTLSVCKCPMPNLLN